MYVALYRKWRPKTFDDVVGQEHVTTTLKNEVIQQKTAHSYLLTGSRGTGKTSCAKILAMAVNCTNPQDGNPCLECESCKGIQDGTILDVLEMDAASNNGVDDVRILREEANYTPAKCKYRVYIIDETHMLSTSAFNALLKIMEEPPEHVKFILATTEVHKVPATILSRCQRFDFGRIKPKDIAERLLLIAGQETFTLEQDAAFLIARLADGAMRDALSILDQCIAFSRQVGLETVSAAVGTVSRDYLFELTGLLSAQKTSEVLACVDRLHAASKDLQRLLGELMEYYRNLMVVKTASSPEDLLNCLPEELEQLKQQSGQMTLRMILRAISVLQEALDKTARNYDKRLTVEMAMIKIASPELDDSIEALQERIERLELMMKNGRVPVPAVQDVPVSLPAREESAGQRAVPDTEAQTAVPAEKTSVSAEPIAEKRQVPVPEKTPDTAPPAPSDGQPEQLAVWPEVLLAVKKQNPALAGVLSGSMAYVSGQNLFIDSPIALFGKMIKQEGFIKTLVSVLEERTGIVYKLRIKKSKPQKQKLDPLDEITKKASEMGIEVKET